MAKKFPHVKPEPRLRALDDYAGQWVAVLDDVVVAHGATAREVVQMMREMGRAAEGAVLLRAASATEALAVGLG